ncbi:MAG: DUF3105 domain-containing protein [Chloroflexi bacterium]|nr:MAG: DUF3105 domain-containing protein [Chloroflexota bacterium]
MGSRSKRRVSSAPKKSGRRWIIWGAIALGVIGLVVALYFNIRGPLPITGLEIFPRQARGHAEEDIAFGELPPVGGEHRNIWQNCGIYEEVVEPAYAVHSMEHGAIWITYQPDLAEDAIAELQDIVRDESFVILSPYPGLRSPIVLSAWQVQLELDGVENGRISDFIEQYLVGPYTPERGASCSGGVGEPIP